MKLQPYVGNFRVSGQGCQAWLPRLLFSSWLQDLRSRNYILEQLLCTPRRNASWPTGGDKPKCVYTLTTRVKTDHFGVKTGHLEPRIRHMNQTTGCLADTPNQTNESDKSTRQPGVWQTIVRQLFLSDSDFGCSGIADFLRLIDVNAGGLGLKKGQGILHLRFWGWWPWEVKNLK